MYELKCQETLIFEGSVHRYHKSCSKLILSVMRFNTTPSAKMLQNQLLREINAQVLQIVFLAALTVLRLITTVRAKMSENPCLHQFRAQKSQIVFSAYLTVLRPITSVSAKMSKNSYLREFSARYDRFTAYYTCMRENF